MARVCFRYDPLSLLHGVFFSQGEIHGNPKFPRIVSGFVEADKVQPASKGGARGPRRLQESGREDRQGGLRRTALPAR